MVFDKIDGLEKGEHLNGDADKILSLNVRDLLDFYYIRNKMKMSCSHLNMILTYPYIEEEFDEAAFEYAFEYFLEDMQNFAKMYPAMDLHKMAEATGRFDTEAGIMRAVHRIRPLIRVALTSDGKLQLLVEDEEEVFGKQEAMVCFRKNRKVTLLRK